MTLLRKLGLLLALSLLTVAATVTSASATTVTPTGVWTASTTAAVLTTDGGTMTCDSTASGTVSNATTPSDATLTTLSFTNCTATFGANCTVTVNTGVPATGVVEFNQTTAATTTTQTHDASTAAGHPNTTVATPGNNQTPEGTIDFDLSPSLTATVNCPFTSNDCTVGRSGLTTGATFNDVQSRVDFDVPLTVNAGSAANCTGAGWTATYDLTVAGSNTATVLA